MATLGGFHESPSKAIADPQRCQPCSEGEAGVWNFPSPFPPVIQGAAVVETLQWECPIESQHRFHTAEITTPALSKWAFCDFFLQQVLVALKVWNAIFSINVRFEVDGFFTLINVISPAIHLFIFLWREEQNTGRSMYQVFHCCTPPFPCKWHKHLTARKGCDNLNQKSSETWILCLCSYLPVVNAFPSDKSKECCFYLEIWVIKLSWTGSFPWQLY